MTADIAAPALAAGLAPTPAQLAALDAYRALLQRWNAVFNLTSLRNPAEILSHHLADCMAVVPALRRQRGGGRLLDVGSGGGLPGAVIAILAPEFDVTCIDAVGKKAAFIRQLAGTLGVPNLHAVHGRVETVSGYGFDVVTSRAFASLADFVRLTANAIAPGGVWMAMKGKLPADELSALPPTVEMFHVEQLDVPGLDAERCLVWMRPRTEPGG